MKRSYRRKEFVSGLDEANKKMIELFKLDDEDVKEYKMIRHTAGAMEIFGHGVRRGRKKASEDRKRLIAENKIYREHIDHFKNTAWAKEAIAQVDGLRGA